MLNQIDALVREARLLRNSDPDRGIALADDAVGRARAALATREDDQARAALASALAVKGHCHRVSSALADAVAACTEACELYALVGDALAESLARSQWGIALVQLGDLSGGLAQMERSLDLSEALGNEEHVCDCLLDIGVVHNMLGNDARAIELYAQAASFFERVGDHYHHATCLSNTAYAHTCWGRRERAAGRDDAALTHFAQAQQHARAAIGLAQRGDDLDFLTLRYVALAEAEREAGELDACLGTLEAQLPITEKLVGKRTQALCLVALAEALIERAADGDDGSALGYLRDADRLCEANSLVETHAGVLRALAKLHETFGRATEALVAYKRFHEVEIRIRAQAAERDVKTIEARLRVEHVQKELDQAKAREQELTALNTRLRDQQFALERLAHVDALTGLANRRAWLESLERAWGEEKRNLYVYLLDLDYFKLINDTYGHTTGDDVLVATAQLVSASVGAHGEAARFGGEEFVAWVRVDADRDAVRLAARILDAVREHRWTDVAPTLTVTASLGVSAGRIHATPFDALSEADQNMYLAKRAGRNRMIGMRLPST